MWVQYCDEYSWKLGLWYTGSMCVASMLKITESWKLYFEGQIGKIVEDGYEVLLMR